MQLRKMLASALLIIMATAPAQAQNENALVMVPEAPSGAVVAGCFQSDRPLFGFGFTMCLRTRGTFIVTGRGLNCEGRLTWQTSRRDITINLRRQSCGGGQAWEAARVDCRASGVVRDILDRIFGTGANPFVMVPDTPAVRTLRCTYWPTVPGVGRVSFTARRV